MAGPISHLREPSPLALNYSIIIEISRKIAFGTTWVWRGLGSMKQGPNATICLVRRQNHAGTTVSWTTVQREKSSHAYKLSSNVQTACSTDSLNNCPKHSILRFSSFALKIYLWLKMCQPNLPCSIVNAHCLLPRRAFASLYVLLFLEKEAEIGGRVHGSHVNGTGYRAILPFIISQLLLVRARLFAIC